jgi:UPF0755 protein
VRRLLAVLLVFGAFRLAWVHEVRSPRRATLAMAQTLLVPQGASADTIGRELCDLGFVSHAPLFRAYVTLRGAGPHLRAGEYSLDGPLSMEQVVDMLVKGEVARHDVTFPEGRSLEETSLLAESHGLPREVFLAAAKNAALIRDLDADATDLEGYLFPDTYDFARSPDAPAQLVGRMVGRFRDVVTPVLPALQAQGLSVRQAVTLASIVELETARAEERPRIAAVFLNRLRRGMPLQTDPTVIYALRKAGHYDGNIHKKDLDVDSPYNTYRHPGLPPGPIASPGRESLRAVADPAEGRELYFVSRNDGSHQFSETLAEHERAVDKYQRHRSK